MMRFGKFGRRLRHVGRRFKSDGLRGYIEGIAADEIHGWAYDPVQPEPLRLGLFTAQGLLATTIAMRDRPDVRAAGFGDGRAGFGFALSEELRRLIAASDGRVEIRTLGKEEKILGQYDFPESYFTRHGLKITSTPPPEPLDDPQLEKCRALLFAELEMLREAQLVGGADALPPTGSFPLHQKLFAPVHATRNDSAELLPDEPPALPAYLDFTRYRCRVDKEFDTDNQPEERAHFLDWYLRSYSAVRQGRRIPLSREVIAYLNAPLIIPGERQKLTRAMWRQFSCQPHVFAALRSAGDGWYTEACYWWVKVGAPALGAEDCLVPGFIADTLSRLDGEQRDKPWPLTPFMHRFYRDMPGLHFLNGDFVRDRELLTLSLLVMALRQPYLLRYVPAASVTRALAHHENGGPSPFERFLRALLPQAENFVLSEEHYAALLRDMGFDLSSRSFMTTDLAGNRFHAAALPAVAQDEIVDVQMIGPFEKASGLGQATRLSAAAMKQTGLSLNKVDFGLDNPAPEGFSTITEHGGYKRARINLIHLNAESIPNAFAYEPDVFNGAYNIGYFFWELDSPAACHHLALELLDEIWVSSQYGVEIYQPHTDIPVTRVGMCFEDIAPPSRSEARDYVTRRFRLDGRKFVFLVAFDSFSFVQRKNPLGVLRAFRKAFEGDRDVRLIVKTQNRDRVADPAQQRIWAQVEALMAGDPRILLINETLPYQDLIRLKAGVDCYISLHRSEGWGFGMIEAMNLKVPVVCTGYSGNMEFCSDETAWLVDYELVEPEPNDYIFVRKGQKWAEPDIAHAAHQLRAVRDDPETRARKVKAAHAHVQEHFTARAIGKRYETRLREILASRSGRYSDE